MSTADGCTLSIGRLAPALALAIVCAAPAAAQQGRNETTFTWSRALPSGALVSIVNVEGPIQVREATTDRVEVRATKHPRGNSEITDVSFEVNETAGGVEICTVFPDQTCRRRRWSSRDPRVTVDYVVLIPRTIRLDVVTGNGELTIDRAGAELKATTGNGRITIGQTAGNVNAVTGNGDVAVRAANGPVRAATGNGHVYVTTGEGAVNATTGNGNIDVHMKTLKTDQDMRFSTGSGDVRLALPENFAGRLDATTGTGTLRSDFEIRVLGRFDARHVRGTIGGGGGSLIRIVSGAGQIELRKEP